MPRKLFPQVHTEYHEDTHKQTRWLPLAFGLTLAHAPYERGSRWLYFAVHLTPRDFISSTSASFLLAQKNALFAACVFHTCATDAAVCDERNDADLSVLVLSGIYFPEEER